MRVFYLVSILNAAEIKSLIPEIAHQQLWELLKRYFIVGGLPEVVVTYVKNKDRLYDALVSVRAKQESLIRTYYADIAKHSGNVNAMHIDRVLRSIPTQLSKTLNTSANKFKFKDVIPGCDRYRQLTNTIDWILNAGLIIKANIVDTSRSPLKAYVKESRIRGILQKTLFIKKCYVRIRNR